MKNINWEIKSSYSASRILDDRFPISILVDKLFWNYAISNIDPDSYGLLLAISKRLSYVK